MNGLKGIFKKIVLASITLITVIILGNINAFASGTEATITTYSAKDVKFFDSTFSEFSSGITYNCEDEAGYFTIGHGTKITITDVTINYGTVEESNVRNSSETTYKVITNHGLTSTITVNYTYNGSAKNKTFTVYEKHTPDYTNSTNRNKYIPLDDNSSCKCKVACKYCNNFISVFETTEITSKITQPTCTKDGNAEYTATFLNNIPEYTWNISIDKLGHDFDTSISDNVTYKWYFDSNNKLECKAIVKCNNGCNKTKEIVATDISYKVTKNATCTEDGELLYTATFDDENLVTQTLKVVWGKGHTYSSIKYYWKNSNSTCEAQIKCANCEECIVEYATVTSEVTKETTCTEAGIRTYTAKFENSTLKTQTKTESIDALGHDYVETVVPPTCTEQGYTLHKCSRCGDEYKDNYTDATSHSYTQSTIIQGYGSCSGSYGYYEYTCTKCGATYTETFNNAIDHNYTDNAITTGYGECTGSCGYHRHTCQYCGTYYDDNAWDNRQGHNYTYHTHTDNCGWHYCDGLLIYHHEIAGPGYCYYCSQCFKFELTNENIELYGAGRTVKMDGLHCMNKIYHCSDSDHNTCSRCGHIN